VLTNKNAISVDQDKLGIPCFLWTTVNGIEVWLKPLADGNYAACFLNRNSSSASLDFNCKQTATDPDFKKSYTMDGSYDVFDIWNNKNIGTTRKNISATVKGHDALFVLLRKK
jgi:alpha-galactosidase